MDFGFGYDLATRRGDPLGILGDLAQAEAARIVAEKNFGATMVAHVIRTVDAAAARGR